MWALPHDTDSGISRIKPREAAGKTQRAVKQTQAVNANI